MENGKVMARYATLQMMIGKMFLDGSRRLEDFVEIQQDFVNNPRWRTSSENLALLKKRLVEGGRIELYRSLSDGNVLDWLDHADHYPRVFKERAVFLWRETRDRLGNEEVAYLIWHDNRVLADWVPTKARLFREYPPGASYYMFA